jgi:acyl carrier protein
MAPAANSPLELRAPLLTPAKFCPPRDAAPLHDLLRRCSEATRDAAARFRATGGLEHVPAIVVGVVERFAEPERRARLRGSRDHLRLIEDLGLDSLSITEIVMLAEEVLQVSISNEDLNHLRTVGDVVECAVRRVSGRPATRAPVALVAVAVPGR